MRMAPVSVLFAAVFAIVAPAADAASDADRARNRRVELKRPACTAAK